MSEKPKTKKVNHTSNANKAPKNKKSGVVAEKKLKNPTEKAKKAEKKVVKPAKELKKPASFSKNVKNLKEKKADGINKASEAKRPEAILPKKSNDSTYFETLALNTDSKKQKPRIIPRDVTRVREEIEHQIAKKPTKTTLTQTVLPAKRIEKVAKLSGKEIKEQEIKKAITAATRLPDASQKRSRKSSVIGRLGWARMTLMVTCAATAALALVCIIDSFSTNMPLKEVAAYSGIEASYPNRVPRGYELSDVTSASGKVTMTYKSGDSSFVLSEEASNWDSTALLNNYIKKNYSDDEYSIIVEQGLTIYMGGDWEAWINGGILYKLNVKSGSLTKKQLKTIATSL